MFWRVIDKQRESVLKKILTVPLLEDLYMAGGTALALQIGHRESVDFDWFTPQEFEVADLESKLIELGELIITDTKKNTFHGILDGVQITFFRYPNPMLSNLVEITGIPNGRMASILDIAIMKLIACSQRGARKDFIDLYAIQKQGLKLEEVLISTPDKFPNRQINMYHLVKSLLYFDDAEQEPMPIMYEDWKWDEIKKFYHNRQQSLLTTIQNM